METWRISGEPLKPYHPEDQGEEDKKKESEPLKVSYEIKTENPEGLFAIEQVLVEATVPIKRLDKIDLSQHGHRTVTKGLHPRHGMEVKPVPKAKPAGNKPMGPEGMKVPGQEEGINPRGGQEEGINPRGGQDKDGKKDTTNRYSDATPQFRKMPVAMVLVVDQDSAHYLLTALEESKLRFQITQVILTRAASLKDVTQKREERSAPPG